MSQKTLKVLRHELKYSINYFEYVTLSQKLYNVLVEDPHNSEGGYKVRSLYFDAYNNNDFYEKLSGVENRKKIRLRIYKFDDPNVKLEIKRKYNNLQEKKSIIITRDDARKLIQCDYDVLLKYQSTTAKEIYTVMKYNSLRPVVLIEYDRKAFMHPMNNIRITLDQISNQVKQTLISLANIRS